MSDNTETPSGPNSKPDRPTAGEPTKGSPHVGERFRDKILLAVLVAALSFAGGACGTLVASRFEARKWLRETAFSTKREIFSKRMELLERTIKAVNRLQILGLYESSGKYSLIEGEELIRSGKVAGPTLAAVLDGAVRAKEAQAELSAVMTLDVLYFGPKTKHAVGDLQKALGSTQPWWQVDQAKTQAVMDATAEELQFGLT